MNQTQVYAMMQVILAATLFGASAPIAKLLLGTVEPIPLAAFLYLGSGAGLALVKALRGIGRSSNREAQITKGDIPWLAGAILAGGVAAPIVLLLGLRNTPAATASLLLNFEGVATTLLAALVFLEAISPRVWLAILLITAASTLLSWDTSGQWGISAGSLGILGATILWGIDNNLTRNISAKDPLSIVTIKGLIGGGFSVLLSLALRIPFPELKTIAASLLLGLASYGFSITLYVMALRNLGAGRTSTLFGTAPFVGTLLSIFLFREAPTPLFIVAIPLMITGAFLLLTEKHEHQHVHPLIEHEHRHTHDDDHHSHTHLGEQSPVVGEHSHFHIHEPLEHAHPHFPDIHHRHVH